MPVSLMAMDLASNVSDGLLEGTGREAFFEDAVERAAPLLS